MAKDQRWAAILENVSITVTPTHRFFGGNSKKAMSLNKKLLMSMKRFGFKLADTIAR
jgi:hypothetical protein